MTSSAPPLWAAAAGVHERAGRNSTTGGGEPGRRPGWRGWRSTISSKAGARAFGDVEDGAVAVGLRKRGLLSRETRTKVGDRAERHDGPSGCGVGRRRFAEWSHDGAWTSAFLAGAGSAALLLDEPAALTAFADSKIAARLERAFEGLDLNAVASRARSATHGGGDSGGGGGFWSGDLPVSATAVETAAAGEAATRPRGSA